MNTIRANQVQGHFAHFLQHDQNGIIVKHLTYRDDGFSCMHYNNLVSM